MKPDLYWIDGPWSGRLAILGRPRGGDWLEDEVRALHAENIDVVVSALTQDEVEELGLKDEAVLCAKQGIEFVELPIPDRGVPPSGNLAATVLGRVKAALVNGQTVAVHCRIGVGRSALIAAALLVRGGVELETAWDRITRARRCPVPDTFDQRAWVAEIEHRAIPVAVGQA